MSRFNNFKVKTDAFIETGSYIGDGIQLAINSGFKEIYSIELCPNLYQACKSRFSSNESVNMLHGDSSIVLKELLGRFPDRSFTFWLDGHYSGPHTARGSKDCPLMEELEAILCRSEKTSDLIYVDDMGAYREFDSHLNEKNMIDLVKKYRPDASISYEDTPYGKNEVMIIEY